MNKIKERVLKSLDRFERDLGFTAPELWVARVRELRAEIESAWDKEEDD